jgi:hypothetical protein
MGRESRKKVIAERAADGCVRIATDAIIPPPVVYYDAQLPTMGPAS